MHVIADASLPVSSTSPCRESCHRNFVSWGYKKDLSSRHRKWSYLHGNTHITITLIFCVRCDSIGRSNIRNLKLTETTMTHNRGVPFWKQEGMRRKGLKSQVL